MTSSFELYQILQATNLAYTKGSKIRWIKLLCPLGAPNSPFLIICKLPNLRQSASLGAQLLISRFPHVAAITSSRQLKPNKMLVGRGLTLPIFKQPDFELQLHVKFFQRLKSNQISIGIPKQFQMINEQTTDFFHRNPHLPVLKSIITLQRDSSDLNLKCHFDALSYCKGKKSYTNNCIRVLQGQISNSHAATPKLLSDLSWENCLTSHILLTQWPLPSLPPVLHCLKGVHKKNNISAYSHS